MDASTTILGMFKSCNSIRVPDYQRAYSWETSDDEKKHKHVNTFLQDLEDYVSSNVKPPYYFGHFLYEDLGNNDFAIIDGQQRLTTITIFLCAIFNTIRKQWRQELTDDEADLYDDLIKRRSKYKFSTVQYDNRLFRDYVIDLQKSDHYNLETTSAQRIVEAYDYFVNKLSAMDREHVNSLLKAVVSSSCTTHIVNGESDAIQMFIFQNNRGKRPSHLEIIKAQFMYNIHIYGGEDFDGLIEEVKNRFEHIYRYISDIEDFVNEDDVLSYTLQVYANSLWGVSSTSEFINVKLESEKRIDFIRDFTLALDRSFNYLSRLKKDREKDVMIDGALRVGHHDTVIPFFLKSYFFNCQPEDISFLGKLLGDIVLRHRIVSTRADLKGRLNDIFRDFNGSLEALYNRINYLKTTDEYWGCHWNNTNFNAALRTRWESNSHGLAKIILWKYENYLIAEGKSGYAPITYDSVMNSQLEHISPKTENNEKLASGYDEYDEDFIENYLLCLGNFLLLSGSHNESIGNKPFEVKRASYQQLRQQREIQIMTEEDKKWDKTKIAARNEKIIAFALENL